MFNSAILDNMIAVVVVLLVLSLIVQSIQSAIKKLFRVKSLQLEQSLVHLLYYALGKDAGRTMRTLADRMPLLRAFASLPILRSVMPNSAKHLSQNDSQVETLFKAVSQEIKNSGRVTPGGKVALESISKDDLKKFVGNMKAAKLAEKLTGGSAEEIKAALDKVALLNQTFTDINGKFKPLLETTPLAKFLPSLSKILTNAAELSQKDLGEIKMDDLVKLGKSELAEVNKLVEALPDSIQQTIKRLQADAPNGPAATALTAALTELHKGLDGIKNELHLVATLPARLGQVSAKIDEWYSTIMHGFEERYGRSMKTFALVISFITVLLLNANIFSIYRQISANEQLRASLINSAPQINEKLNALKNNQADVQQTQDGIVKVVQDEAGKVQQAASVYTSFGFEGPKWMARVVKNPSVIFSGRAIETLIGWLLMTLLLSVGAPFWQDTLESLFGLKNLLRKQQPGEPQKMT